MAVLAECPQCHKKQAIRNKRCECGADLEKLKRAKEKVRYWIAYRLPGGKQKREAVGFSIEKAKDADGKRRVQKRENRIFDIKPEAKMNFSQLTEWFLGLENVKSKAYFPTLTANLTSFNASFGNVIVGAIRPVDLENYQEKRKREGYSDSYIDQQLVAAGTMIRKAFDNDIVGGDTLRVFKKVKKLLKRNGNARDRILSPQEFGRLMQHLPRHAKDMLATGFYTGMRRGEIASLTWDKVDMKKRVIRLEAADTKDREPRTIPICDPLYDILKDIPRAIHDSHVFLFQGEPVTEIKRTLKTACKAAGITYGRFEKDGFIFHDLRHSFNTYMRKAGVPESVIMEITGHSTREMFDRYNRIDEDDTRKAVEQFQGFIANVDQTVDQEAKRG